MEALAGEYIRNCLHVKRFPCISLVCKLVPVQYREYEYGLFILTEAYKWNTIKIRISLKWIQGYQVACQMLVRLALMPCTDVPPTNSKIILHSSGRQEKDGILIIKLTRQSKLISFCYSNLNEYL